jgi:hypothetical protein
VRSDFILSDSGLLSANFEIETEGIQDGDETVQAARRFAILDLMDHASAYPRGKSQLVLAKSNPFPFGADNGSCGLSEGRCNLMLGMHDNTSYITIKSN